MSQRTDREIMHEPDGMPIGALLIVVLIVLVLLALSGCGAIETYRDITRS